MPEPITAENPVPKTARKRSERTEAKFLEDVDKIIAEAERLGAAYDPPNDIAKLPALKSKREAVALARTANQSNDATEESERNRRENLYKPLSKEVTAVVNYVKSAGKAENEVAALRSTARTIKGERAKSLDPTDGGNHISVSKMSYASRADTYAEFIEQYAALGIKTTEEMYQPATHRAKLAALQAANASVLNAEAAANTTGEQLDKLSYTDTDSLINGCISAKSYLKSKYGTTGQPYKNIAKTRFEIPARLRRK